MARRRRSFLVALLLALCTVSAAQDPTCRDLDEAEADSERSSILLQKPRPVVHTTAVGTPRREDHTILRHPERSAVGAAVPVEHVSEDLPHETQPQNRTAVLGVGLEAALLKLDALGVHDALGLRAASSTYYLLLPLVVLAAVLGFFCVRWSGVQLPPPPAWSPQVSSKAEPSTTSQTPTVRATSLRSTPRQVLSRSATLTLAPTPLDTEATIGLPRDGSQRPSVQLASELVVPGDHECCLLMRRISGKNFAATDSLTVDDSNGAPVFAATFSLSKRGHLSKREGKRLVLRSAVDNVVYAYCSDDASDPGALRLKICDTSGKPFGVLEPDAVGLNTNYSVLTSTGVAVRLQGDALYGNVNIVAREGTLMAVSEVCPSAGTQNRRVRIGPGVDAGLVTVALLGMDLLEYDRLSGETSGRRPKP